MIGIVSKWKKLKHSYSELKLVLHPLFLLLGLFLILLGYGDIFCICTLSALLHEFGHYIVATRLGYQMVKIRLMPFGAELFGDTDCFVDRDEIKIALAGPFVNMCICILCLCGWWISPDSYRITYPIFANNIVMGIFNLLPIFPLDGGRIVLASLCKKMTRIKASKIVKQVTKGFAIIIFIAFLLTLIKGANLTLGIMGFMLYFTASSSSKEACYQKIKLSSLIKSRCVEWVEMSVPSTLRIYELKRRHIKNKITRFVVLDSDGKKLFEFNELDLESVEPYVNQSDFVLKIKGLIGKRV